MRIYCGLICLAVFLCSSATAFGQNKVVVIPLVMNAKPLQNVITVSPSGGDFTGPVEAINSISSPGKYLVVIGPGEYTLSQKLDIASGISIVGSGELATVLTGGIGGADERSAGLVRLLGIESSLSSLTIENTGGTGAYSVALYADGFTGTLQNITTKASGGFFNYGIYNGTSVTEMSHITASATGGINSYGIYNWSGKGGLPPPPTAFSSMTHVSASATGASGENYAVYNKSSYPAMERVTAESDGYGVYIDDTESITASDSRIRRSTIIGEKVGLYSNVSRHTVFVSESTIHCDSYNLSAVTKSGVGLARCRASDDDFGFDLPVDCICPVP